MTVRGIRRPIALLVVIAGLGLGSVVALRGAYASSPTPLLPDVVADPPDNISLSVSEETPTGGHAEAQLLLRFNGYVHNIGPGALDFRGSRGTPNPTEPASPPMNVFQRIYNSNGTYTEEPSKAQMIYVEADGHDHWHLQHVAFYSLWNADRSAEVAPAQKVGFCLEDSERIEETGPSEPVYSDTGNPPREFCRRYQPEATNVFEGVSEGWRDLYESNLAFQWVNVSNVLPGEYWLRAETDPEHLIKQTGDEKPPAYAGEHTVVPGFDAEAQTRSIEPDQPLQLTLTSQRWSGSASFEQPSATPTYTIVSQPAHGKLSAITNDQVTYTPDSGYSGPDSFTFSASDPDSSFPESPAAATVSIDVSSAPPPPSVAIEGAPASMIEGTSVGLSAAVSNDIPTIKWEASAGSITSTGSTTSTYTAPSTPPPGSSITVTAESPDGGRDQRTIEILPAQPDQPKPEAPLPPPSTILPPTTPPSIGPSHSAKGSSPLLSPSAMLIGRKLYMTARANEVGRLRLTAVLHGRRIASCIATVKRHQAFTCTTKLPKGVSARAPIGVWATLRVGDHLFQTKRRPARVPTAMNAMTVASWRGIKQAWRYICGM